jgi:hypothetical protein
MSKSVEAASTAELGCPSGVGSPYVRLPAAAKKASAPRATGALGAIQTEVNAIAQQLGLARLGKFDATEVKTLGTYAIGGKVPLGDVAFGWNGDVFSMIGPYGTQSGDGHEVDFGFFLVDAAGRERGDGKFAALTGFQPVSGLNRRSISSVAVGVAGALFAGAKVTLHVVWRDGSQSADMMTYGDALVSHRVLCSLSP